MHLIKKQHNKESDLQEVGEVRLGVKLKVI